MNDLFKELKLFTCCVKSHLDVPKFNEADLIKILTPSDLVQSIECNFGNVYGSLYNSKLENEEKKRLNEKRGRKSKKHLDVRKRKKQGSGTQFNSQITFKVVNTSIIDKLYPIKVFRNGIVQITGILREDIDDIHEPIKNLCEYLSPILKYDVKRDSPIIVKSRNYKFSMTKRLCLDLLKLHVIIDLYKFVKSGHPKEEFPYFKKLSDDENKFDQYSIHFADDKFTNSIRDKIDDFVKHNIVEFDDETTSLYQSLDDIQNKYPSYYNTEYYKSIPCYDGKKDDLTQISDDIIIDTNLMNGKGKIICGIKNGDSKRSTLLLFNSGKVNIQGITSIPDAIEIYKWIKSLFIHFFNEIHITTH